MNTHIPLEYRFALDVVSAECWRNGRPLIVNNLQFLEHELTLRDLSGRDPSLTSVAVWLEPVRRTLDSDLQLISSRLCQNGTLLIVVSLPLSRLLSASETIGNQALGTKFTGVQRIGRALASAGFELIETSGIHSVSSIGLNMSSRLFERFGRPHLADRCAAVARDRYCSTGIAKRLSTLMLISAQKREVSQAPGTGWLQ